jgi:hypothetical protein
MELLRHLQATWPPWALGLINVGSGQLLLVLLFVPLERVFTLRPKALLGAGRRTDAVYGFLTSLRPPRLVVLPVAALLWALHARLEGSARNHGNHATMLPLMDRVFGTWRRAGHAWPVHHGTDVPVPRALIDQLLAPFMGGRRAP